MFPSASFQGGPPIPAHLRSFTLHVLIVVALIPAAAAVDYNANDDEGHKYTRRNARIQSNVHGSCKKTEQLYFRNPNSGSAPTPTQFWPQNRKPG